MLLEDRIAHLPLFKRRELARIVRVVFEEFENEQKGKLSEKAKCGRILKIILYGSHARGTWRDDRASGFFSDFDLLVIVNYEHFAEEYDAWEWMRERFAREGVLRNSPRPDPSIIVHSYADVNDQLARGRPFFADIAREGIVLYEVEGFPLSEIGPFTPEMRHAEAWMHFDGCFSASNSFRIATLTIIEHGDLKRAAFFLHQSAEELYHCVRLVLTLYSPKLHSLRKLRRQAEGIAPRLAEAWPRDSQFGRRCFNLLHDAYVKGRYSYKYTITREELEWLVARVDDLRRIVAEICAEHLGERPPPPGEEGA